MTQPPENSDEDFYVDEVFEDESMSEVEEEEVQEIEEDAHSESDVEAEFLKGNPHARRQQLYGGRATAGRFGRERMSAYPSSSSEDEGRGYQTQTVVEVNKLAIRMERAHEESLSVRTLVPRQNSGELGSSEQDIEEEEEDDDEDVVQRDIKDDEAGSIVGEESEETEEENPISYDEFQDKDNDIEMGQLMEPESELENQEEAQNEPDAYVVDASDSDCSVATYVTEEEQPTQHRADAGNETDITITPRYEAKLETPKPSHQPTGIPRLKKPLWTRPPPAPQHRQQPIYTIDTDSDSNAGHMSNLEDFLDAEDENEAHGQFTSYRKDNLKADAAAIKFLEQQMSHMSDMIMKTFRIGGDGAPARDAMEQLNRATEMMKEQGLKLPQLPEEDFETSMGESEVPLETSEPPYDIDESVSLHQLRSSMETLSTVRICKENQSKCRCPSVIDGYEPSLMMDECGQGDGLRRHPHQHQKHEFNCRVSSATPTSFGSDNCAYHIDLKRPRSSTDKINYKNLGRKSFSFTNAQVREIERQNHILLKKMMAVKPTVKANINNNGRGNDQQQKKPVPPSTRTTSAAVNRKRFQRQIDIDNDLLKRKLEAIGTRRPTFK